MLCLSTLHMQQAQSINPGAGPGVGAEVSELLN